MKPTRIGIIGLASSHVPAWIRYMTASQTGHQYSLPLECEVAALGSIVSPNADAVDMARIAKLQAELPKPALVGIGRGSQIAADFADHVDAVIIADRDHSSHLEHAAAFVHAGIPLFVDKPLVSTVHEAHLLLTQAAVHRVPIQSYSALRWDPVVAKIAATRTAGSTQLTVEGGADPSSRYGGAQFYGVHSVEIGLALAPGEVTSWEVLGGADLGVHHLRVVSHDGLWEHVTDIRVHLNAQRQNEPFVVSSPDAEWQIPVAGEYLLPGFQRWLQSLADAEPAISPEQMKLSVALTAILGDGFTA